MAERMLACLASVDQFAWVDGSISRRVEIPNQSIQIDPTTANFTTTARETARETVGCDSAV